MSDGYLPVTKQFASQVVRGDGGRRPTKQGIEDAREAAVSAAKVSVKSSDPADQHQPVE